jgi:DNA-binding transcriptional regulator YiaG
LRQTIASDPNAPEKILENGLYYLKLIATQRVKPEFYGDFCNALMAQMSAFINSHDSPGQPPASSLAPKTNPKKVLTTISLKSKERGVKTEVQKLIELVKRKASKPGAKSQLARTLGVAPARISEWLSGEKEPGGEYTLQLLHWVEQQERQK